MDRSTRLVHDALIFGSDEELLAGLVPFVRDGLAQGQASVVAMTLANGALLRDALGPDACAVSFIDREEWYLRPAGTVAGWKGKLDEAIAGGHRSVRFVGEVRFGVGDEQQRWIRYESALNRVFATAPAWILCPYDTRVLPPLVIEGARRTHPAVHTPSRGDSGVYQAPEDLLASMPEPMPVVVGVPAVELFIDGSVSAVRDVVGRAAVQGGWLPPDRFDDFMLALSEVVTNSLRHGRGRRELRVWALDGMVVGEVTDEGDGPSDPLVGYRPPTPDSESGMGLWIAQQVCDGLAFRSHPSGTQVRFAVRVNGHRPSVAEPEPAVSAWAV